MISLLSTFLPHLRAFLSELDGFGFVFWLVGHLLKADGWALAESWLV